MQQRLPYAAEIETSGCTGSYGAFSCTTLWGVANDPHIRAVPVASSPHEKAAIADRDRKSVARCHAVIKQDRYSVSRYHYAAPGCEFGVIAANLR